jgi:hypothetical protein
MEEINEQEQTMEPVYSLEIILHEKIGKKERTTFPVGNGTKPDARNRTPTRSTTPPLVDLTDRRRGNRGGIKRPPHAPNRRIQEKTKETSAAAGSE